MSRIAMREAQKLLPDLNVDAFLVTHLPHIRLLTGFSGSNAQVLIKKRSALFQSDGRYFEQAQKEVEGISIRIAFDGAMIADLYRSGVTGRLASIGFDEQHLPVATLRILKTTFKDIRFRGFTQVIEPLAARKDETAVRRIRKAVAITDKVFDELLPMIKPGVRELDLAAEISYRHKLHGADGDSFEPIVLCGPRSSLIHGRPSNRAIRHGNPVLMDFGCRWQGYCSDMTRTVVVGEASKRLKQVYEIVREAQQRTIDTIAPGMQINEIDNVARGYMKQFGIDNYFPHGLGHGIGLEVHEVPFLSWRNKATLQPGNVVTIEPGVYLPGLGGVRIEDIVLVGESGVSVLTRSTKDLLIL